MSDETPFQILPVFLRKDVRVRLDAAVGVVVCSPSTGDFDFHLLTVINGEEHPALRFVHEELAEYRDRPVDATPSRKLARFLALSARREGAVYFGDISMLRANSASEAVDRALASFVGVPIRATAH
jgi:hypothetical protein